MSMEGVGWEEQERPAQGSLTGLGRGCRTVSPFSPWGDAWTPVPRPVPQAEAVILNLEELISSSPGYLAVLRDICHNWEMENALFYWINIL